MTCLLFLHPHIHSYSLMTPSVAHVSFLSLTVLSFKQIWTAFVIGVLKAVCLSICPSVAFSVSTTDVSPVNSTYHLDGAPIPSLDHCRDLGVIFSNNLSWSLQYDAISAKAYRQLGLIRRTFSSSTSVRVKKLLYLSLVRSQITYCSQVWRPHLIKDITSLERIQRRATRLILNDFSSDYRTRLISLHLLPLMYLYELLDVMFFVKCFKSPDPSFPIWDHVSFSTASTRSASAAKLNHKSRSSTLARHTYFCRLVRIWNTLPPIDLSLSLSTIKLQLKSFSGLTFFPILTLPYLALSMFFALVAGAANYQSKSVLPTYHLVFNINLLVFFWLPVELICIYTFRAAGLLCLLIVTVSPFFLLHLSAL